MNDVLVLRVRRARPRDISLAGSERHTDRVETACKFAVSESLERPVAHARHDLHIDGDISRIGDLDAKLRDRRTDRAHAKRDDVHRPAGHTTVEFALEDRLHLVRGHPVIGRAGIALGERADVCAVLDTGDVRRMRTCKERIGPLFFVEFNKGAGVDHLLTEAVVLFLCAVAPVNAVGFA